jgi:SAM-dependent methyltransferase
MKISSYKQLQFLLWQRTQYRSAFLKKWVRNNLRRTPVTKKFLNTADILEWVRVRKIDSLHTEEISKTFESFSEYVPSKVEKTLDIGAGLGGIDVFFANKFDCTVFLLDKNGVSSNKRGGFYQNADDFSYYNDFSATKEFLLANKVSKFEFVDMSKQTFPKETFDLVVSFLAWGFHFSVDTYLEDVYDTLRDGGLLVMDIRNESGGIEKLEVKFKKKVNIIQEANNYTRIAIIK